MKKSVLGVLNLALAVVNLALTCLLIFTCMPAISKTGNLVDRICQIIDLDVAGATGNLNQVDVSKLEEVAVTFNSEKTTNINLKVGADGKEHYAVIGVTLVIDTGHSDYKEMRPTIENNMSTIDTVIIGVVNKYTKEQVKDNMDEIRKEILGELQQVFYSKFIYDVTFTSFVAQ